MTTTQLDAEKKHIEQFETNICPQYGIKPIFDWGTGSKNKKSNCDADRTVQIINLEKFNKLKCTKKYKLGDELTVSLKTKKGNFTIANGGTGLDSSLFKRMILPHHTNAINEIKRRKLEIREYQEELGKDKRWEDVGQDEKLVIKHTLQDLLWLLFNVPQYREKLYKWLSERQSDLKCVGDRLYVPEKIILPELCEPKKWGDDTVIVGHYKLRVKAAGGKVCTSWKINYQINQE